MRSGAGALTGMMMTLKGLPLAYNKDMQEDKEGLFDALDTWLDCLHMAALVLDGIQVKRPRCQEAAQQGYSNATELADYLVAKGVPFREAHHIVGEAVVEAIRQGKPLEDLPLSELQKFSLVIGEDVYPILSLQSCLDKRAAKAVSHRNRWRRRLLLRRRGWGKNIYMYKFEPGLSLGFLWQKSGSWRSAKVHVGFSYSS